MNGLERCLAVLRGDTPDCVPVVPQNYLLSVHHCGYQVRDVVHDGELLADRLIRACEELGYDGVAVGLDNAASAEFLDGSGRAPRRHGGPRRRWRAAAQRRLRHHCRLMSDKLQNMP